MREASGCRSCPLEHTRWLDHRLEHDEVVSGAWGTILKGSSHPDLTEPGLLKHRLNLCRRIATDHDRIRFVRDFRAINKFTDRDLAGDSPFFRISFE